MKEKKGFFYKILWSMGFLLLSPIMYAGIPLWTFLPLTPTTVVVPTNSTATIQYQITNQSTRSHTLVMRPIRGITQVTSGVGVCGSPFVLASQGSCTLTLVANGSQLIEPVTDGPIVCQYNSSSQCYRPGPLNILNVRVNAPMPSTPQYTVGGAVSGLVGSVTLLNNGTDALTITSDGSFTFSTPITQGYPYAVTVQTQPVGQSCVIANGSGIMGSGNVTNVTVTCLNNTTLSVPFSGTIPVNNTTTTEAITVTNTGTETAYNVHANLPISWANVVQDASACAVILAGNSCQITFRSPTPYIAQADIVVTGDNISTPPSMPFAFSIQGLYVFAIESATQATVIDSMEFSGTQWGLSLDTPGTSLTDGFNNTALITAQNSNPADFSAAKTCFNSTRGGAPTGTWYLPAICQMGPPGLAANCPAGIPNIYTNLVAVSLLYTPFISGAEWSSTQAPPDSSSTDAYSQDFILPIGQNIFSKSSPVPFVCVRSIAYP